VLAAEHDMPMWRGYGLVLHGWAAAEEGRPAEGAALARQGIAELDALGAVFHRTHHLCILAEIHGRLGDHDAGLRAVAEALAEVARTEVRLFEAEIRRMEGELRRLAGAPDPEVEACLAEALAVARRQEALSFELRAATSLARLRAGRGERQRALDLLAPVHARFTEGFDAPDLQDAASLLAELGAPPTR
jgi:predicted ATPase